MRILAADLSLSAQHSLTQTHTRSETLAAGIVTGAWNADSVDVSRQRQQDLSAAAGAAGASGATASRSGASLLDDYVRQLSPEQARQVTEAQPKRTADSVRVTRDGRALAAEPGQDPVTGSTPVAGRSDVSLATPTRDEARASLTSLLSGIAAAAPRQETRTGLASLLAGGLPDVASLRAVLDDLGGTGLGSGDFGLGSGDALSLLTQAHNLTPAGDGLSGTNLLARIQALVTPQAAVAPEDSHSTSTEQLRMDLIRAAVEAFTGRRLQLLDLSDLDLSGTTSGAQYPTEGEPAAAAPPPAPAFGLAYEAREVRAERETTSFQAAGAVRTADGRQIDIEVNLTMDRELVQESSTQVRVGAALQDPLVVNYGGTAAQLTQRTYDFDLDTDGQADQIHFVGPGSGFLAWDRNANGAVDDGSELFGPATGQGFAELAAHDDDGNGFIDEGDAIWADLRIWEKDGAGNDRLLAVGQRGVGAIYLGNADTPFQVTDAAGQQQGQVRSTGIYLREDGGAGTVQHLDLVV